MLSNCVPEYYYRSELTWLSATPSQACCQILQTVV